MHSFDSGTFEYEPITFLVDGVWISEEQNVL